MDFFFTVNERFQGINTGVIYEPGDFSEL